MGQMNSLGQAGLKHLAFVSSKWRKNKNDCIDGRMQVSPIYKGECGGRESKESVLLTHRIGRWSNSDEENRFTGGGRRRFSSWLQSTTRLKIAGQRKGGKKWFNLNWGQPEKCERVWSQTRG